jgi:glycyl-tRNA synthetase beta subunit
MKKQDIIRIINEEVDIALDEMYDPIYDTMLPEIVASLIVSGVTIKQIIKFILEKYKNTKNGDKLDKDTIVEIIKKAKSKLNESINEEEEVYNVIDRETKKLITDTPLIKSLALKLAAKKKDGKWIIQKPIDNNENEGMKRSLKDIDPNLSLTKVNTTPPSFKITYMKKEDMSNEMEEKIVAWILSKGGKIKSVSTQTVYFKF